MRAYRVVKKPWDETIVQELANELPTETIDFHAHFGLATSVKRRCERLKNSPSGMFTYFDFEDHRRADETLGWTPEKRVFTSLPFWGIDWLRNDQAVRKRQQVDATSLLSPTISSNIDLGNEKTIQLHFDQFPERENDFSRLYPVELLEECAENGIILLANIIPKRITSNCQYLSWVGRNFKKLKIVALHMGCTNEPTDVYTAALKLLRPYESIFFDTALMCNLQKIQALFNNVGYQRVVFASDQPFNTIRATFIWSAENGFMLVPDQVLSWYCGDRQLIKSFATPLTLHHQNLLTLIQAIKEKYVDKEEIKNNVFFKNAEYLIT